MEEIKKKIPDIESLSDEDVDFMLWQLKNIKDKRLKEKKEAAKRLFMQWCQQMRECTKDLGMFYFRDDSGYELSFDDLDDMELIFKG